MQFCDRNETIETSLGNMDGVTLRKINHTSYIFYRWERGLEECFIHRFVFLEKNSIHISLVFLLSQKKIKYPKAFDLLRSIFKVDLS